MIDAETWWDRKADRGENGVIVLRPGEEAPEEFLCKENTAGGKHFFVCGEGFAQKEKDGIDEETSDGGKGRFNSSWDKRAVNEIMRLRNSMVVLSEHWAFST